MQRSFTDRVFGGVCGGLGALVRVNPWWFRIAFVVLSIVTLGVFAAVYLLLWWLLPQESLVRRRQPGAGGLLLVLIIIIIVLAAWFARNAGALIGPEGQDLLWPTLLLVLSIVFVLRQIGGRA